MAVVWGTELRWGVLDMSDPMGRTRRGSDGGRSEFIEGFCTANQYRAAARQRGRHGVGVWVAPVTP